VNVIAVLLLAAGLFLIGEAIRHVRARRAADRMAAALSDYDPCVRDGCAGREP
jgi:hypothetical protein